MNIFDLHKNVITDYRSYIESFLDIRDDRIREIVDRRLHDGELWPAPLVQFNPSYQESTDVNTLVNDGVLDHRIRDVFSNFKLYEHQVEAIKLGAAGRDFVVTSGTGSGKSLTFLGTIFNHVFRERTPHGILAIIVYPMNALINSQSVEFGKHKERYEKNTGQSFPIRFAQYTGQEGQEERERIIEEKPHILLTNYMMMELIMTRRREERLRKTFAGNLRYLVYDELHTYRGRQGSDVGMLNRRIREAAGHDLVCIGTSATMASGHGTLVEQRKKVADVAVKVFGKPFSAEQVIEEKLTRQFHGHSSAIDGDDLKAAILAPVDSEAPEADLFSHPIAVWLEREIGLEVREEQLVRRRPLTLPKITEALSTASGVGAELCGAALQHMLEWVEAVNISRVNRDERPLMPFKLHQFIAQTGSVYVTLEDRLQREITLEAGYSIKDAATDEDKPIFPTVFSRLSGHDFVCVTRDAAAGRLFPRQFFDLEKTSEDDEGESSGGYVILDDKEPVWSDEYLPLLPDSWLNRRRDGTVSLKASHQEKIPRPIYFDATGKFSEDPGSFPFSGWYMKAPIAFDPTAGTFYDSRTKEFTKLSQLGSEARSTATSVLSRSIVRKLGETGIDESAQKLLSFTDNRQDASLQSGHFNDFVRVIHLRSAIYHALEEAPGNQLEIAALAQSVFAQMALSESDYARNPIGHDRFRLGSNDNEGALKLLIFYRALYDLRRGWRIVLPNLEQCGLLRIEYKDLRAVCEQDDGWQDIPGFKEMRPARREEIFQQILDFFRRSYSLDHVDLEVAAIEKNVNIIRDKLKHPWALDEGERLNVPAFLRIKPYDGRKHFTASIGYQSQLGRYLRNQAELEPHLASRNAYDPYMEHLLNTVGKYFLNSPIHPISKDGETIQLYRLDVSRIIWTMGNGETVIPEVVRLRSYKESAYTPQVNVFFREVYRSPLRRVRMLTSAEHTGQLNNDDRKERERLFREGQLSTLFCSPTMELGIDIADLNVVHMRNVPPNPANYAQRSGRAGRSGQAALVFTYCASQSPHDRHYFKNSTDMVAGVVAPPNIDLSNQELMRTHLHAMYMAEVGMDELDQSISAMVDMSNPTKLELRPEVQAKLKLSDAVRQQIATRFKERIVADLADTIDGSWYSDDWVLNTLSHVPHALNEALDRWRQLYQAAFKQLIDAQKRLDDPTYKLANVDRKSAEREERQARRQRELLTNDNVSRGSQTEFYPYRYLASEGFLPGYNFTRLPARVFLPIGDQGEFISRPRSIALNEFGPYNQIYHNGSRYEVVRQQVTDLDNRLEQARVSRQSGYFLKSGDDNLEFCPFTHAPLKGDTETYTSLIQMTDVQARPMATISCEEEERTRKGFDIDTFFAVDTNLEDVRKLSLRSDDKELLSVKYIQAARLYHVNNGWRFYRQKGFYIEKKTGFWKKTPNVTQTDEERLEKPLAQVRIYTTDTADALYIHPSAVLGMNMAGILTLQFAIRKAIENVFRVEPREISGVLMGKTETPNIMIYESAEASLGVLSQIVDNPVRFREVIKEAYHICYFDLDPIEEGTKPKASYDDLLSYYNQRHHKDIDRHLIKGALEALMACEAEAQGTTGEPYDEHYHRILRGVDANSTLETTFVEHLYQRRLRLPDQTQYYAPNLYVQPDFFYQPNVVVFVDGSVHDDQDVRDGDERKRRALRNDGFRVIEYGYRDDLDAIIERNADIFTEVK